MPCSTEIGIIIGCGNDCDKQLKLTLAPYKRYTNVK